MQWAGATLTSRMALVACSLAYVSQAATRRDLNVDLSVKGLSFRPTPWHPSTAQSHDGARRRTPRFAYLERLACCGSRSQTPRAHANTRMWLACLREEVLTNRTEVENHARQTDRRYIRWLASPLSVLHFVPTRSINTFLHVTRKLEQLVLHLFNANWKRVKLENAPGGVFHCARASLATTPEQGC